MVTLPVASERSQHCGGEARPKGPKLEARRAEQKRPWVLGEGAYRPFPPARGFAGEL